MKRSPLPQLPFAGASFGTKIVMIFLFAAMVQLAVGWISLFRPSVLSLDWDEGEYWMLSSQILAGVPMELGRRTVAYPLFLAGLRSISDNLWFVQSAIAVAAATAPPLLAILVMKLMRSETAAVLAGLALAIWPAQVFYGTSLYSETIALPVFLVFLILLPMDCEGPQQRASWPWWVVAGLALGITAHVRPMYELFLGVLPFVLWLDSRGLRATMVRFALLLAGFALVVAPWSIYVSREIGSPTLLTANGGETFAGGLNPQLIKQGERSRVLLKRVTWDGPGKWLPRYDTGFLTKAEQALPYGQQDRLLQARTVAWIRDNPGDAAYLSLRKLSYMWGIYPFAGNGWPQAAFGNMPIIALSLLFFVALWTAPKIRHRGARLYLLPLFVTGVALISWGSWRFRLPADAGMIGVVASWLAAKTHANANSPLPKVLRCSIS